MSENAVKPKIYEFAKQAVLMCKKVEAEQHEFDMTRQLRRSATSINANYAEAEYAASKADFLNKLTVALKEASESKQWVNLLHDTEYITDEVFQPLNALIDEIIYMLTASTGTLKKQLNK